MVIDSNAAKHQDPVHGVEDSGPAQRLCSPWYMSVNRPSVHAHEEGNASLEGVNA